MKEKKTIVVKDPHLRKLRYNLRMIIIKAVSFEWNKLHTEEEQILYDDLGDAKRMDSLEIEQFRDIEQKKQFLRNIEDKSICLCPSCQRTDLDMTYNPKLETWFCTNCYGISKRYYRSHGQPQLFS